MRNQVFGDIEMEDLAPAMLDDEETIQNSKGECWDSEEIEGGVIEHFLELLGRLRAQMCGKIRFTVQVSGRIISLTGDEAA